MNATKKIVVGLVCLAASVAGISASAEQTLAEQTKLTGAAAIAKFPKRLQDSDIAHLADASWCQLMPGVEYFYGKFDKLYDTEANDVSFYKIDYKNAPVRMKFVDNRRNGGSNKQTSYVANKYDALFGINCTFPAWYAKMENQIVNDGNKEGGLALNDNKTFEFFKSSWWKDHPNADGYSDAFSTEAMGLYHGSQGLSGTGWGRAPYTFMGATQDGILYVCVVDGRTGRSEGLGYGTTHSFLVELGCYDGMCIDGGGSTTMVCRKDLMPVGMNELQHASDNADANPYYYTMNHTSDNPERAVCNQLLFVEDVANVTPTVGRHGSCKLGSTALGTALIKFDKNVTQTLSVTADSGYVIAALSVDGAMVDAAKGRASYSDSILLNGDKMIAVSFVKKGAWWLNPTMKNDFLLEAKAGNNGSDLTTQHPDVCLDEQERDVFFSTSVHGYSSGSYWTGLREFSVTSLKGWNTGDAITPVMGTDKNVNGTGTYAYSIAASRAAGAVVAMQKVNSGTKYPVVCPIGGQWGGGTAFNSTRDDRYVMSVLSFPDDKNAYHTTSPGVFGTDGKHFFGGYNRNAHIVEFDVKTGTDGHLEFHHTGKVIKHKAQVTGLVCKKVVLGGVPKDVLFTSHHSTTLDSLDIVIPGEMAVQTNSSGLPTCLTIPYHLDNIAVTGIADGTPRIIGHVLDTANAQHGNYVVYDLKDDLSGLRFPDPIAIVNAQSAFGKATGCLASLDDDTTAFINYYNAKELHALTVQGNASDEPAVELIPVAKPTAATGLVYNGSAQTGVAAATGYTVSNGSGTSVGSYTATVTLEDGYCWADESTDALSIPWSIGQKTPTLSAVTATAITYGQTLSDSVVSATVEPDVAGTFTWTDASIAPTVADGGVTIYTGTFTPNDTKNYRAAAFETTVAVNRKEINVPTANTGLVFNFGEQTGVEAGEGYTLTGEKATAAGDYEATASLTDKDNTCWADDQTFADKTIAWSIAESTVEVAGVAEAGLDWNGSEVGFDISGLNLGSHTVADLLATFEVNGKTYSGQVTARGTGVYGVSFAVDAEGENAVVAAQAYEGTYRVTLGGEGDPVEVVSGTQTLLQGRSATETNGWFRETAATLGQSGSWTKGGEAIELPTEDGRIVIEPTGASPLVFTPQQEMDERTKGVVEASLLFEGPSDEDDIAPADGAQCGVRIAEDDETEAIELQVYAALPDGDGGWTVGWHDWNQAAAETYSFAVGTEYAIRLVCDYETGSNGLKCYVKAPDEEEYALLFEGYLTGAADAANAPKRVTTLAFEGTGKVSILDGDFTHDYIDASVAEVGGMRFLTVADAVAAANGQPITLLHRASWKPSSAEEEKSAVFVNPDWLVLVSAQPVIIDAGRIGVCSWSWHDNMTSILARMKKGGFKGMQLALSPWIWDDDEATDAQKETFGDVEGDEVLALIRSEAEKTNIVIHATMICFADEDYTSTTTISNTCGLFYGIAPSATDEQKANAESKWAHRSNQFERAAILTGELGVPYLTAHLGLSGLDDAAKGYPRLAWAIGVCKQNGCKLLIETGMYSAEDTAALLTKLVAAHPELKGWVGLNFDSANQILYGADTPTRAFPILRQWIDQVHIKDCVEDPSLRGGWATDVEWGLGDVSTKYDFIAYLRENGFKGPLLVEHESGEATADARAKEILTAVQALLTSNNADDPECPTPDWIDPSLMEGDTPAEKSAAAMKAQGFDEASAAAVAEAGEGAYGTVSEWSQVWANGWQTRGEAKKPMPADIAAIPGVLTSAAIGADAPLAEEDVKVTELKPSADGSVTLKVSLGEYQNLKSGNEALLKAALGVSGAYGLGSGESFSADNVGVTAKEVGAAAVELKATPKPVGGQAPDRFFFRATAR